MFSDGKNFFKRASMFQLELKKKSFPNAKVLAKIARCSKSTAQRTIDRLRRDYALPISYDEEQHGYYLTNLNYEIPLLSPGKDELTALLLLRDLAAVLDASDIRDNIDSLWYLYASKNPQLAGEPEQLASCFSSDLTIIGVLSDCGVLELLQFAHKGTAVEIIYRSPWLAKEDKTYRGLIHRVHFSDGNLYILFTNEDNRSIILNASFLKNIKLLDYDPFHGKVVTFDRTWPHGFGIWHGVELQPVEIKIKAPGSLYFASQIWHESQEDSWEGDVLIRKMRSALSPQLISRIISLGSLVTEVKPQQLKDMLIEEVKKLLLNLSHVNSEVQSGRRA